MTEPMIALDLELAGPEEAAQLFGNGDVHLRLLEDALTIRIVSRGGNIMIDGAEQEASIAQSVLSELLAVIRKGKTISERDCAYAIQLAKKGAIDSFKDLFETELARTTRGKSIRPKTVGQLRYIAAMQSSDLVFGIGPAGTGKTYLAVVMAVQALKVSKVERIILTRPAVEAGESLGFLPGDLKEKVDPYLRPLYDALHDVLGADHTQRLIERGVIEIAPLAYMRGRTLDNAFVILDEAQNTTSAQMKMFLTRLGFGSRMVITGDRTQIDLPKGVQSGLTTAAELLKDVKGLQFLYLEATDVVRHQLVSRIIEAYERE
ncbi:PhoH family protein [Bacillus fonticola]|uniref:PhoH family protein n=1 Tax=Bacillus fonticola TaxID=2728853 RepID=UPI001473ED9F|nr:PhoH family protein [Bacillus fonticola]